MHSQHFHDFSEGVTGDVPDFLKSVPQKSADFQQDAGKRDRQLSSPPNRAELITLLAKEAAFQGCFTTRAILKTSLTERLYSHTHTYCPSGHFTDCPFFLYIVLSPALPPLPLQLASQFCSYLRIYWVPFKHSFKKVKCWQRRMSLRKWVSKKKKKSI